MISSETKALIGIGVITLAIVAGAVYFFSGQSLNNSLANVDQIPQDKQHLIVDASKNQIATDSAKVTVVEFGDYQCPACEQAYPIVKNIINTNQGKINFVFRNFPLPQHQNARIAAEAAEAAGAQGKYWEMHDKLYDNQAEWADLGNPLDKFVSYAEVLGLDVNKFKDDVSANKYADIINKDQSDGNDLGVNSTPTFFINNKKVAGTINQGEFQSLIDSTIQGNQ